MNKWCLFIFVLSVSCIKPPQNHLNYSYTVISRIFIFCSFFDIFSSFTIIKLTEYIHSLRTNYFCSGCSMSCGVELTAVNNRRRTACYHGNQLCVYVFQPLLCFAFGFELIHLLPVGKSGYFAQTDTVNYGTVHAVTFGCVKYNVLI